MSSHDVPAYEAGIIAGDRKTLARAITLVESSRREDEERAQELLEALLPHTGGAHRIGVTGVPGVGKSTFIEAFGTLLTGQGRKVAVLAVDPSSARTGGSILGDKTRMPELARDPNAFVRPSPGGRTLGGVARRTREALLLCEAAGFDVVLVETIGVGQSEAAVHDMVDFFLLLMLAGAGDELQGIKRGVIELAHGMAVTKADGDNADRATAAKAQLQTALRLLYPPGGEGWRPSVQTCSALTGDGLPALWDSIQKHRASLEATGGLAARRLEQRLGWIDDALADLLHVRVHSHPAVVAELPRVRSAVADGSMTPTAAARLLVDLASS